MTDKRNSLRLMLVAVLAIGIALLTGGRTHPRTLYHTTAQGSTNIHFSHDSGFYEEPFYLEIHVPSGEIYYTLDGSEPDRNATRYTGPIYIGDASAQENVLSARTDISSWKVTVPTEPVDKCTVLRVRYYDALGRSESCTESYFVVFSQKEGYEGYPILSLVMDPEDLVDGETGIYIQGDSYDGDSWSGNYYGRGRDWERQAYFQYFSAQGELQTAASCGVRIKGNWSRRLPQKSLNLFARTEYGGLEEFKYDFWGTGYFPDVMTLHSGGNDTTGKMKNRLITALCEDEPFATHRYVLCQVFLNGEYWGLYDLTEGYTAHYIARTYGVPEQSVVSMKATLLEEGNGEKLVEDLNGFANFTDFSKPENYEACGEKMDMDSLIRYYAVMLYCARNTDWPVDNTQLWRTITATEGYRDGKWRYMLYDMDSPGMEEEYTGHDTVASAMERSTFFRSLMGNKTFRQQLGKAMLDLSETDFEPEHVRLVWEALRTQQESAMAAHYRRWYSTTPEAFYDETEEYLAFFENRPQVVRQLLKEYDMLPE